LRCRMWWCRMARGVFCCHRREDFLGHNRKSPIFLCRNSIKLCRKIISFFFYKKIILTMVRPPTLRLGKGARCRVLVKNLRPSCEITECILNPLPRQHVTDLVATRRGIITRGRSTYEAIFFMSATFPDLELHAAKRYTLVDTEGYPDRFWTTVLY